MPRQNKYWRCRYCGHVYAKLEIGAPDKDGNAPCGCSYFLMGVKETTAEMNERERNEAIFAAVKKKS